MVFKPFGGFLFAFIEGFLFFFEDLDFCGDIPLLQLVLLVIQLADCVCVSVAAFLVENLLTLGEAGAFVFFACFPVLEAELV